MLWNKNYYYENHNTERSFISISSEEISGVDTLNKYINIKGKPRKVKW